MVGTKRAGNLQGTRTEGTRHLLSCWDERARHCDSLEVRERLSSLITQMSGGEERPVPTG